MTALRRPGTTVLLALSLLVGAAFLTQVVPYQQILDSQRRVSAARAELASLQAENAILQADVDALQTDAEVEKLAREKLGYVMPGETAYIVLDPPGTVAPAAPEPVVLPEHRTWVEQVWDFLTGADLED